MVGIGELFRQALGSTKDDFRSFVRGASAGLDVYDTLADPGARSFVADVIMPWAMGVARVALVKWGTRRRKCGFVVHGGRCSEMPITECAACGRPVCLVHAFIGYDATAICWPCMKHGTVHAKPWKPGNGRGEGAFESAHAPSDPGGFDEVGWAYTVLGVSADVSDDELMQAYRKACMEHHPDRATDPNDVKARTERFKQIQQAMTVLKVKRNL